MSWPETLDELIAEQERLARLSPAEWTPPDDGYSIGGCFVCFPRGYDGAGATDDPAWAGAAILFPSGRLETASARGASRAPYRAGLLALREGPTLEAAVRALAWRPDVLLVNATGRDHPRRAGLALHLGWLLDLPSVGVTHRPLGARGEAPVARRGAHRPLELLDQQVGALLCTGDGRLPLAVHAAWRTSPETAIRVVLAATRGVRTPEPIRAAREVARKARAAASRRDPGR